MQPVGPLHPFSLLPTFLHRTLLSWRGESDPNSQLLIENRCQWEYISYLREVLDIILTLKTKCLLPTKTKTSLKMTRRRTEKRVMCHVAFFHHVVVQHEVLSSIWRRGELAAHHKIMSRTSARWGKKSSYWKSGFSLVGRLLSGIIWASSERDRWWMTELWAATMALSPAVFKSTCWRMQMTRQANSEWRLTEFWVLIKTRADIAEGSRWSCQTYHFSCAEHLCYFMHLSCTGPALRAVEKESCLR